jgi:hypothetical protein
MHAHIEWESQDCDGVLSGSYAKFMTDKETASEFPDLDFQYRVLASVAHVSARRGTLTVEETEDGTPLLYWSEATDEGGRSVEATFYTDEENCGSDHTTTRRDHQAEAAGY